MKTPLEPSPYYLIQEHLREHPWRLLVAVMMLNQTSAKQVWPLLDGFFERWPDALSGASADRREMAEYIKPLGLYNRRSKAIIQMSMDYYVSDGRFDDVRQLYGIGKYGADSYNMFIGGEVVFDVQDKELRNYVRWAESLERGRAEPAAVR